MRGKEMTTHPLGFSAVKDLLGRYGVPLSGLAVAGRKEALAAAEDLGYPVALKALSSRILHKTDVGAVELNLKTAEAVGRAWETVAAAVGPEGFEGMLVQAMAESGLELFIGAKQDPGFGPVTMVGLGGRYVELFKDVSPGIGVLGRSDVLRMLSETKAGRILDGLRGVTFDREAVADLVARVSRLMDEHPEVLELDLNPVIVFEKGCAVVDARLIAGDPVSPPRPAETPAWKMDSLNTIFAPRSVAVVGASRPGTMGGIILKNLMRLERVYPVNPRLDKTLGLTCYPSLSALPEVPDVAVFAVNAEETVRRFEEFCRLGGKGAVVFSDGFAEIGRRNLENRLLELGERHHVAYVGPNCMGVMDNFSGLNTLFLPEQRTSTIHEPSGIGVISQSGGVGVELLEMLEADNLALGKWVSCGNASSVGVPELLAHMGADPRIKIIAVYLEGIANGLQLMEVGRQVSRQKPVLVIKGGLGGGAAATLSHTASLAGSHEAFRACCHQAGFFLIEELTEDPKILVNALSILTSQPRALGNRVAVVSVGGGAAVLLSDQITAEGLALADFAPETRAGLRGLLEGVVKASDPEVRTRILTGIGGNPVDLFGSCDDDRLLGALEIIDRDPNTDIILTAIYLQVPYLSEYLPEKLVDLSRELTKPLIVSPRGFSQYVGRCRAYLYSKKFHTYTVPMIKPLSLAVSIWQAYGRSFA
jgi:3-hydroxypropionyl-CoA synthetase (ADP-forming)